MRITDIREAVVPISSPIRNAYIDFSKMTASVVAVVTDVVRDGAPVIGYGFNSNGRYAASGLLNERFLPRLREADPGLVNEAGDNLDPHKVWAVLMANEKPGGHGERSVAVGVIDMAVWDAVAKIAGVPLYRHLADTYGDGTVDESVFVYAAGGYYYPGKDDRQLQEEMRRYRDMGYEVVKMKIGGAPLDEDIRRIESVLEVVGEGRYLAVDANGRFDLDDRARLCRGAEALRPVLVRGGGRPARLRAAGGTREGLPAPDGDRREPVLAPGRPQPRPLRRHAAGPRLAAVRLRAVLRAGRVPAHARGHPRRGLHAAQLHPPRRPPALAEHRRGPEARRQRELSGGLRALRRLRRRPRGPAGPGRAARRARHRLRGQAALIDTMRRATGTAWSSGSSMRHMSVLPKTWRLRAMRR
jgi:hypothetical protein